MCSPCIRCAKSSVLECFPCRWVLLCRPALKKDGGLPTGLKQHLAKPQGAHKGTSTSAQRSKSSGCDDFMPLYAVLSQRSPTALSHPCAGPRMVFSVQVSRSSAPAVVVCGGIPLRPPRGRRWAFGTGNWRGVNIDPILSVSGGFPELVLSRLSVETTCRWLRKGAAAKRAEGPP